MPMLSGELRLDKWLNFSCLFKTRSQATKACEDRRVKVNGQVAKPAKMVKVGDYLTIKQKGGKYINLTICGIVNKNISLNDAKMLYELEQPKLTQDEMEMLQFLQRAAREIKPRYKGRPTKKERRKMERIKKISSIYQ
jgi:ribosome-associated heat shock protein Hsp15